MNAGSFRMPDGTLPGRVRLRVRDLDRALAFYRLLLGLEVRARDGQRAALAPAEERVPLLLLEGDPEAVPRPPGTTGLYHFALLLPHRRALARAFLHLARRRWPFHGFSDHRVSEALYLPDPEGNGIELYADRPREAWPLRHGRLWMDTRPLDLDGLLAELDPEEAREERGPALPPGTRLGHIHLHVSRLEDAEAFYAGALGLEVTVREYPGALFFAAGDYHHHVGVNVWAGIGAPRPPERATGLVDFSFRLPTRDGLERLLEHLQRKGYAPRPYPPDGMGTGDPAWCVRDPDGHAVVLEGPAEARPAGL